jgi:hypothetical protein
VKETERTYYNIGLIKIPE